MHACMSVCMYVERDDILLGTGAGPSSPRSRPHVREQLNLHESISHSPLTTTVGGQ